MKASSEIIADGTGVAEAICERAGQPEQGLIVMGTHGRSGIQLGVLGSVSEKVAVAAPVPVIHVRGSRRPNSGTFKKILIAHDFSDPSREAVRIGGAYARQLGADVTLMHVFEIVEPAFLEMSLPDVDRFAICDAANSAMASDMEALKREGTSVSRHTTIGRPAQQIVAHAIANDFDLIVVGTQGRTGFRRFVMGSVARRVICTSEIPVMSCRQV